MVKDLTKLDTITLENKTNEVVAIRHYLTNFVEKLNPGDKIEITPRTSEELSYCLKVQESLEESSADSTIDLTRELTEEISDEAFNYWAMGLENYKVVDFNKNDGITADVYVHSEEYPEESPIKGTLTTIPKPIERESGCNLEICVEDLESVDLNNVVVYEIFGTHTYWYEAINHYLVAGMFPTPK